MYGILGIGQRDVREIEVLGRSPSWTEKGLEYASSDKHRQTGLEWLGVSEESKTVNSAAVKSEEMGQEEDEGNTGGKEEDEVQELGGDTELHESGQVGRAIRHGDGEPTRGSWKSSKKACAVEFGNGARKEDYERRSSGWSTAQRRKLYTRTQISRA